MNNDPFNQTEPQAPDTQPLQSPGSQPAQPITPQQPPVAPIAQPVIAPAPSVNTAGVDPGKTLGIVGIVLAFVASLIGLILSIVSLSKSKKAGYKGTLGLVGIILNAITTLVGGALFFLFIFVAIPSIQNAQRELEERASSSITEPTTDDETGSDLDNSSPNNGSSATEAARLNTLGTVADATLQKSIISYISIIPGTDSSISSKDVVAIRSTQVNANTFDEEWDVKNGASGTVLTFSVHMVAAASGGVDFSVTQKK